MFLSCGSLKGGYKSCEYIIIYPLQNFMLKENEQYKQAHNDTLENIKFEIGENERKLYTKG